MFIVAALKNSFSHIDIFGWLHQYKRPLTFKTHAQYTLFTPALFKCWNIRKEVLNSVFLSLYAYIHLTHTYARAYIHTQTHTHSHTSQASNVEYLLLLLHFSCRFFPFGWFTLKPSSVCAVVPLFRLFVHHIHEIYSRSGYEFSV